MYSVNKGIDITKFAPVMVIVMCYIIKRSSNSKTVQIYVKNRRMLCPKDQIHVLRHVFMRVDDLTEIDSYLC